MKKTILFILLLAGSCANAQQLNRAYLLYIEAYREAALETERLHHIPACITLAQGLLESGAGLSELATEANNHFGIKCHEWTGETYSHDDDREQECFRKYERAEQSYEDHARFLMRKRYARLFNLEITDYRGWANGLRECGYATDPNYGPKLIKIIEDYQLMLITTATEPVGAEEEVAPATPAAEPAVADEAETSLEQMKMEVLQGKMPVREYKPAVTKEVAPATAEIPEKPEIPENPESPVVPENPESPESPEIPAYIDEFFD